MSQDFKELQLFWYKKLKDSGFIDAETQDGRLKDWPAIRLHRDYGPEKFQEKQAYFRAASHFYWEHQFETQEEKAIWALHANGFSLREIVFALRTPKNSINKDNVQKVIQKLSRFIRSKVVHDEE